MTSVTAQSSTLGVDAHFNAAKTYDFYKTAFGRDGVGRGTSLSGKVVAQNPASQSLGTTTGGWSVESYRTERGPRQRVVAHLEI